MFTFDLTDQCIILTLNHIQGIKSKKYSIPSQLKILELLSTHYHIVICLRTLNYHLAKLEEFKYIYRQRRNPINVFGERTYQTTMYSLAKKAYYFLSNLMGSLKNGYYSIKKYLQKSYISPRKELNEDQRYLTPEENARRFRELLNKIS